MIAVIHEGMDAPMVETESDRTVSGVATRVAKGMGRGVGAPMADATIPADLTGLAQEIAAPTQVDRAVQPDGSAQGLVVQGVAARALVARPVRSNWYPWRCVLTRTVTASSTGKSCEHLRKRSGGEPASGADLADLAVRGGAVLATASDVGPADRTATVRAAPNGRHVPASSSRRELSSNVVATASCIALRRASE